MIVPGKIADATLAYLSRRIATPGKNMPSALLDQLIAQRNQQQSAVSWDDFTQAVLTQAIASLRIDEGAAATQPAPTPAVQIPFDPQSLQMVRDDLLAGKLPIVRSADQITLTLHLTDADVAGCVQFANAFRAGIEDQLLQQQPDEKPDVVDLRKKLGRLLNSAAVTAPDKSHVQIAIDLTALFNSFDDPIETNPPADKGMQEGGSLMTAWATKNLDVDPDLTVEQVEDDFKHNTLKSYPPQQSVDPGTDLGPIQPATQPAEQPASPPPSQPAPGL